MKRHLKRYPQTSAESHVIGLYARAAVMATTKVGLAFNQRISRKNDGLPCEAAAMTGLDFHDMRGG